MHDDERSRRLPVSMREVRDHLASLRRPEPVEIVHAIDCDLDEDCTCPASEEPESVEPVTLPSPRARKPSIATRARIAMRAIRASVRRKRSPA